MENKTYKDMTAIEFLKEAKRMCEKSDSCFECKAYNHIKKECNITITEKSSIKEIEEAIQIVHNWSKDNPVKTMADVLFELFPEAPKTKGGFPTVCPSNIDKTLICTGGNISDCFPCKAKFWSQPVE